MDHEPDAAGFAYRVGLLDNGTSQTDVCNGFATSAEFTAIVQSYGPG